MNSYKTITIDESIARVLIEEITAAFGDAFVFACMNIGADEHLNEVTAEDAIDYFDIEVSG